MNPFKGRHFQRDIILWTVRWHFKYGIIQRGVSLDIESVVTPVFATLIFDDIIGLLKSIWCLNRATMSSAPDEPQKNYTGSDEPFRYTGVSLDIENYCTLSLFFDLLDFGWSQPTKLTGSRYPVAFLDIITCQIDVFPT